MRVCSVAVVGLGNVGTAFAALLRERGDQVRAEFGLDLRLTGVMTRSLGMAVDLDGLDLDALAAGRLPDADPSADAAPSADATASGAADAAPSADATASGAADAAPSADATAADADRSADPDDDESDGAVGGGTSEAGTGRWWAPYDVAAIGTWLEASGADVLVELSAVDLGTGEPATSFLRAALERGIHAVTANKGPVVHAYRELDALADAHGVRFRFEAATADCLPVYTLYRESLPLERPRRVRGLVNGTTSVILEAMEAGASFDDGVRIAQERGIAEADPSLDVDGFDAAVKVVAIANVLMGADLRLGDLDVTGIRGIDPAAVQAAADSGAPIRLVATVERDDDGTVRGRVAPEQLPVGDPFHGLDAMALGLHFDGDLMPGLTVVGHHLTPRQTAYGVLVDVLGALRGR